MAEFDFKRVFEAGGYDTYNPHLNHDAKHLTIAGTGYYRLANLVKQQMAQPGNTRTQEQIIAAVAQEYSREFGPAQTTIAKITPLLKGDQKGLKHGDYSQVREEPEVAAPKATYSDYQTALRTRGWRSAGGDKSQYHDRAIAFRFFGPGRATVDIYVRDQQPYAQSPALGWYLFDVPHEHSGRGTGFDNLIKRLDALGGAKTNESHEREAWVIHDDTGSGQWYYWVETQPGERAASKGRSQLGGPFPDSDTAGSKMIADWGNPGGWVSTTMSQWENNTKPPFYQMIAGKRKTEDAHDVMPRKNKIDQADAMLNMKSADEILAPVAASNKPTPNITEAQNRLWECGCDAMDDQESSMAFAVDGIGNIMQIAKVDNRDNDPDYQLESDWFGDATQELIDRCSAGEEWIEVVNELAQRFAEFFDGAYQAHDFASDAFGRRAWEMGLWEAQGMAAEFARSGKFILPESAKTASMNFRGLRKVLEAPTKKTLTKVYVVEAKREGYVRVGSKPVFESMPSRKTKLVGRFWPV